MKRDVRAPVIRLLTVPQVADRLGLTQADVDRLVESGELHAVNVSPHGGRRFWPADVGTCAAARALSGSSSSPGSSSFDLNIPIGVRKAEPVMAGPGLASRLPIDPPHRARTQHELQPQHPRWPRFEVVPERASSNYLAFRDAEHVTAYLRARATLDIDASHSVHTGPSRAERELAPV